MKRAIMIAALILIPATATAWDNRYRDPYQNERNTQALDRMANEMEYQGRRQEYIDQYQAVEDQYDKMGWYGEQLKKTHQYNPPKR